MENRQDPVWEQRWSVLDVIESLARRARLHQVVDAVFVERRQLVESQKHSPVPLSLLREERGSALVFVALFLGLIVLGLAGAWELNAARLNANVLQTAVDSGALAGATQAWGVFERDARGITYSQRVYIDPVLGPQTAEEFVRSNLDNLSRSYRAAVQATVQDDTLTVQVQYPSSTALLASQTGSGKTELNLQRSAKAQVKLR